MVKKFRRYVYSFWHNPRRWQTDGWTDTAWRHRPRLCIASRGNDHFTAPQNLIYCSFCGDLYSWMWRHTFLRNCTRTHCTLASQGIYMCLVWNTVAYLGFQKGGGGETPRWWGAGERSGEGAVPPPQKKNSFLRPQNNNFRGILTRFFISYRCNNRVQNPFSVPYDLLRVFEDDITTI